MFAVKDLSVSLRNGTFDPNDVKITHLSHSESARKMAREVNLPADLIGPFCSNDHIELLTHAGTHVDAPWHFGPMVEGKPAKKIDEVPLEWCFGNGVLLDFSQTKKSGEAICIEDVKRELLRINYDLKPMDIVLIRTGAEEYFDRDPNFGAIGSGLVRESFLWLLDQGIRLMGTDAFTLDIPIVNMVEKLKNGGREAFFPIHYGGREREHIHAEKLSNLKTLAEPCGFKVAMFPIKIDAGSAGWTRAVAIEGEGVLTKRPEIVDLSVPILAEAMEGRYYENKIQHCTHMEEARKLAKLFGCTLDMFSSPVGFANDFISCSSHAGTHLNSPWHFGPIVEGKPAKTIDQVPLEWCYGDGVLLDFAHKKPNDPITVTDLIKELERIKYELKPDDIVLFRTGAEDHYFYDPNFCEVATGLSGDALMWLFGKGIKTMGTDSFTLDISIQVMLEKLKAGDRAAFFPVHCGSVAKESCHAEKLFNLKMIPKPYGFKVAMFPIKLENCSAGWVRAVAIL
jgi:kynurenine formamidase